MKRVSAKNFQDLIVWQKSHQFVLNIAQASLEESRYYLILAKDLGYGDNHCLKNQLEETSKLL